VSPEQHNKWLGWLHIGYGTFYLIFVFGMMIFMAAIFSSIPPPRGGQGPPPAMFGILFGFMALIYGFMMLPSFIAGYALLKRKPWAKVAAIIGAIFASMFFPFGVCVYTFWFLFSDVGKSLYDKPRAGLPPAPPEWLGATTKREEPQYVPPASPPNWR
jgi:hypothetical protein